MKPYLWFAGLWALAFLFTPGAGETALGGFLARAIASFGIALIFGLPVIATLEALKWWRRKKHL